ncbi:MAG: 3,4-dehydroadipyl-CoA semialdehyde dehydrogenase [Myxococcota bacterium]|nr:3,4-dehydroadipyl-CoA semialdehyde dehydrogenase [Myxococcota bacterium]
MKKLASYLCGQWQYGEGAGRALYNPSTEDVVAYSSTEGLPFEDALRYASEHGGPALRALTFAQRGDLLKQMSRTLYAKREELLEISRDCNGATRGDSKFDVDGATGTLSAYARIGASLGERTFRLDGEADKLSSNARYIGQHVLLPRPGVAVHINAFNFPAWGTFEKIACAFLAGMPVITKPATATSWLTYEMVKLIIDADILPKGTLSFIAGSAGNLLSVLGPQDAVAFTGAASTASSLRAYAPFLEQSTRFNAEADSLNAAVLGPDVEVGDDLWYQFVRNVLTDIRQKAGQKCTAIRRIIVPENRVEDLAEALLEDLATVRVGYPVEKAINMGPVASAQQLRDVRAGIDALAVKSTILCGGSQPINGLHAPEGKGYFVAPTLLKTTAENALVHELEVFGPCSTIISYSGTAEDAASMVARGQGCLVSSAYSNDRAWLATMCFEAGPWNGRLQLNSKKIADSALPPGMVLPNQLHGGPGRAGGGEELGGVRGLDFYSNRIAVQGERSMLSKLLGSKL